MQPQRNNKENPNNFFAKNIREKGEDFLINGAVLPNDIQYNCIRILRDLAKNRIDIPKYTKQFCEPVFIQNCIIAIRQKYMLHDISAKGVLMLIESNNTTNDPNIDAVYQFHASSAQAYSIALNCFENLASSKNIMHIMNIPKLLSDNRLSNAF